jgi:hypothetical protein
MVTAKLVLDQIAAVTENVPATETRRSKGAMLFTTSKSQICKPYPRPVIAEIREHSVTMHSYSGY